MSYKYKVKQDADGNSLIPDGSVIPSVGVVKGGFVTSAVVIENPNLELVGQDPAPTHLNGVVSQSAQITPQTSESEGQE